MDEEDRFSTPSRHSKKWDDEERQDQEAALYGPVGYHPNTNTNSNYGYKEADKNTNTNSNYGYKEADKPRGGIFGYIFKIAIIVVIFYYIIGI